MKKIIIIVTGNKINILSPKIFLTTKDRSILSNLNDDCESKSKVIKIGIVPKLNISKIAVKINPKYTK